MEVLEHLIEMATPKFNIEHIHSFYIDYLVKKCLKRLFDYEEVVHLHQYYAFLQFFLLYASHFPFSLFVKCCLH